MDQTPTITVTSLQRACLDWLLEDHCGDDQPETQETHSSPGQRATEGENKPILSADNDDPDCSDYTLHGASCWISIGNLSVYIVRDGHGVAVQIYPRNQEMDDEIAGACVLFSEA